MITYYVAAVIFGVACALIVVASSVKFLNFNKKN